MKSSNRTCATSKMKRPARLAWLVAFTAKAVLDASGPHASVYAANIVKADNATALNSGASWIGGTAPGTADVAVFDNTITSGITVGTGTTAQLAWLGIKVANPTAAPTISGAGPLRILAGGIDMSTATTGITLNPTVLNLGASQTWSMASMVTFSSPVQVNTSSVTMTVNDTGTVVIPVASLSDTSGVSRTWNFGNGGTGNITVNSLNNANQTQGSSTATLTSLVTFNSLGTMTLNGNNTQLSNGSSVQATVRVSSGTLIMGNAGAFGGSLFALNGGQFQTAGAFTIPNTTSLTTSTTISGTQPMTFAAPFTVSGANRTLTVNNSALTTLQGQVNLQEATGTTGRTMTVQGTGSLSITGNIVDGGTSGSSTLAVNSANVTVSLSGTNTYSGATTLSNGNIILGNKTVFGTSTVGMNGVNISATTPLTGTNSIGNTVTLGGTNIFTGTNSIELSGTVTGTGNRTTTNNLTGGGTFLISGPLNLASSTTNLTQTFNGGDVTLSGIIANGGTSTASSVRYSGTGTLFLTNAANTYAGSTTFTSGTIIPSSATSMGTSAINFDGGTLVAPSAMLFANAVKFNNTAALTGTVGGSSNINFAGTFTTRENTLTVNNTGTTEFSGPVFIVETAGTVDRLFTVNGSRPLTISGVIANTADAGTFAGKLSYSGSSTLTLSNVNTYTGATSVNSGTLTIAGSGAIASTTVNVAGGATLNANGALASTATLTSNGTTNIGGNSSTVALGTTTRQLASLSIGAAGQVNLNPAAVHANMTMLDAAALTFASPTGGQLDIKDNAVLVRSADTTDTARNARWAQVVSGQNNFDNNGQVTWDGPGIISSTARTSNVGLGVDAFVVGVVSNHDLARLSADGGAALPYDNTNPWLGNVSSVGADDILVRMTYAGDTNLDGQITIDDYNNIDGTFSGLLATNYGWVSGDFDFSGVITIDDYNAIDSGFLYQGGQLTQGMIAQRTAMFGADYVAHLEAVAAAFASVPEPTTAGVLAIGAMGLLSRRRRNG